MACTLQAKEVELRAVWSAARGGFLTNSPLLAFITRALDGLSLMVRHQNAFGLSRMTAASAEADCAWCSIRDDCLTLMAHVFELELDQFSPDRLPLTGEQQDVIEVRLRDGAVLSCNATAIQDKVRAMGDEAISRFVAYLWLASFSSQFERLLKEREAKQETYDAYGTAGSRPVIEALEELRASA